jgi:hypothetical protein
MTRFLIAALAVVSFIAGAHAQPAFNGGAPVTITFPPISAGGTISAPIVTNIFSSNSGAPTIASGACGATNNGTITGDNQSGKVTIGASATATCAVTFSTTFPTGTPKAVVLTPANAAAAALAAGSPFVSAVSTTGFTFQAAAVASTTWYYHAY